MTVFDRPRCTAVFCALLSLLFSLRTGAQQIVYNNTAHSLDHFVAETNEFGTELILGGTARTVTDISFEYYGDFLQQGDERCVVRLYTNEKPYDLYRNEPTTVLYESGAFPISPGYRAVRLSGLNIPARDVVTFTIEAKGLAPGEGMGLLLYGPPVVGHSFNELWRRNQAGLWEAVFYDFPNPNVKTKAAILLTATNTIQLTAPHTKSGKMRFGINGMSGADYVLECSNDLKTWTAVSTNAVPGLFANCEDAIAETGHRFYRVRLEK